MLNVYRASAGSGKTHRLTGDYIELLFSEKNNNKMYRRILAVTFTNKATEEMKSRIVSQLFNLANGKSSDYRKGLMMKYNLTEESVNAKARKILISLLHDYSAFSVSTIDRFFQQLIRSFARESGINGSYNLELDNENILQQATDNLFLELTNKPDLQLLSWLTEFANDLMNESKSWNPRENIVTLGRELFKESFQTKSGDIAGKIQNHEFLKKYKANLFKIIIDFENKMIEIGTSALKIMNEYQLNHSDFSRNATKKFDEIRNKIFKDVRVTFAAMAENAEKCYIKKQMPDIVARIHSAYNAGLGKCFSDVVRMLTKDNFDYNSAKIILKNINTLGVLSHLDLQIKELTDDQNAMLISDANMLVNRIIDDSDTPFIFEKTGVYTDNFMIDEFQDTSSLQWRNFKPLIENSLATDNFNLVVGDVKQSIYRWRNSDWKLLDRQIAKDFRAGQLTEITLDTNWRSDKNIVNFNNALFSYASHILQAKLNEQINPEKAVKPEFAVFSNAIAHAYYKLEQKTSPHAGNGVVRFEFIDKGEDNEKWTVESLNRLPRLLEEIQDLGFSPRDVAILVREKKDTKIITQKLLEYKVSERANPEIYCYDVLGNEGLLISKSHSVNFLVSLMRLFVQPDDVIGRTTLSFEYLKGKQKLVDADALHRIFNVENTDEFLCPFFSDDEKKALKEISNLSLYEMTEQIVKIFGIADWNNDTVFLQAFLDEVFVFSTGRKSDTGSFLKWWDEKGAAKFIPVPETLNAFQIMTIHKSKGLDFKVVIMPFCDWELDMKRGNLTNYLWCEPNKEPYNSLPVLPVEYGSKLENSIFEREYFDEKMHRYIDNLNLAYVAFTRAKHSLICFTKKVKKPDNLTAVNSVAGLLNWCFSDSNISEIEKPEILTANFNSDNSLFKIGENEKFESQRIKISEESDAVSLSKMEYSAKPDLKLQKQKIITGANAGNVNPRRLGIIMHALLSKIQKKSDQKKALQSCISNGIISAVEKPEVLAEIEKFWLLPQANEWFADDAQILNEATILTPQGEMYRPDRVALKENTAIVVDYKFGEYENNTHKRQVKEYMNLLAEMEYKTKGYIYYVNLGKVVEVV